MQMQGINGPLGVRPYIPLYLQPLASARAIAAISVRCDLNEDITIQQVKTIYYTCQLSLFITPANLSI